MYVGGLQSTKGVCKKSWDHDFCSFWMPLAGAVSLARMKVYLWSFGYRFGGPPEPAQTDGDDQAQICLPVVDVRKGIIDPFQAVGNQTGLDQEVSAEVLSRGGQQAANRIVAELKALSAGSVRECSVCVGCVGGRHRSVAIVEEVARSLRELIVYHVDVNHRDIEK